MIEEDDEDLADEPLTWSEWWGQVKLAVINAYLWHFNRPKLRWNHGLSIHRMRHVDPALHEQLLYAFRIARAHLRRGTRR
jgi:hypothetical protein